MRLAVQSACLMLLSAPLLAIPEPAHAKKTLQSRDLFDLQYVREVQIAPDGERIAYSRAIHDIMCDCVRSNVWVIDSDGENHQPLLSGRGSYSSPRFSPSGNHLAYVATDEAGTTQLFVRWLETGQTALVSNLVESPSSIAWSPDGEMIAFTMQVPAEKPSLAKAPDKPEGANWAEPPVVIDSVVYRFDGRGYLNPGFSHVFVVPADGGAARQLTAGDFNHQGPLSWMPDGSAIVFAANRDDNWQYELTERDLYRVALEGGALEQLTDLPGVEADPAVSPDGQHIAFVRDDHQGKQYSLEQIAVVDADGDNPRVLNGDQDRTGGSPQWSADSQRVYFHFDDRGERKLAHVDLRGNVTTVLERISGTTIGRPYLSGDFDVANDGRIAFAMGTAQSPADVHISTSGEPRQLTQLNRNLLDQRAVGEVREIVYESAVDGTEIQGWYLTPPGFDPDEQYPLILEIHGGPHLAYGPHFSSEMQRFAAEGYVVFYDNHRGSSG